MIGNPQALIYPSPVMSCLPPALKCFHNSSFILHTSYFPLSHPPMTSGFQCRTGLWEPFEHKDTKEKKEKKGENGENGEHTRHRVSRPTPRRVPVTG